MDEVCVGGRGGAGGGRAASRSPRHTPRRGACVCGVRAQGSSGTLAGVHARPPHARARLCSQAAQMAVAGNIVGLRRLLGRYRQLHKAVRARLEGRLRHETERAQRLQVGRAAGAHAAVARPRSQNSAACDGHVLPLGAGGGHGRPLLCSCVVWRRRSWTTRRRSCRGWCSSWSRSTRGCSGAARGLVDGVAAPRLGSVPRPTRQQQPWWSEPRLSCQRTVQPSTPPPPLSRGACRADNDASERIQALEEALAREHEARACACMAAGRCGPRPRSRRGPGSVHAAVMVLMSWDCAPGRAVLRPRRWWWRASQSTSRCAMRLLTWRRSGGCLVRAACTAHHASPPLTQLTNMRAVFTHSSMGVRCARARAMLCTLFMCTQGCPAIRDGGACDGAAADTAEGGAQCVQRVP